MMSKEGYSKSFKEIASGQNYKERDYWLNKLSGDPGRSCFPYDYKILGINEYRKDTVKLNISGTLFSKLTTIAKGSDVRLNIILVTGLVILLQKYTGSRDITIGVPIYKQDIDGEFVNTVLALRNRVDYKTTFRELLSQVSQTIYEAVENQNYPIEALVKDLNMPNPDSKCPLFDIAILLENIHHKKYINHISFSMIFSFKRTNENIDGVLEFNSLYYHQGTTERIINHFKHLLREVFANPDSPLSSVDILSVEEKKQLVVDFNDNIAAFSKDKTIFQLIERQSEIEPDCISANFAGQQITYRHLNERANQLARLLQDNGIGEDSLVGILLERSFEMLESIIAVWKVGGAYIPIDTGQPLRRTLEIMNDSTIGLLITQSTFITPDFEQGCQVPLLKLDKGNNSTVVSFAHNNFDLDIDMNCLAYVIYTSGSTGKPKGVMVEHIGMMNHISAKINELQLSKKSVVAQNASHTFDISLWQFFAALVAGGKTVIYPHELILALPGFLEQLIKDQVTILEVVPSYLSLILNFIEEENPVPLSVEYLLATGEELKPHQVKQWFEYYPDSRMVNAYGPTEASDDITHYSMNKARAGERIPIGKPLQNLNIYIVDENMNLSPPGVQGEICVSGVGVGRGYLNDIEKTAKVFLEDPFIRKKGVRLYKTGDMGRWLPDGTVEFLGRKDYQVKIRGFRIELSEIENKLTAHRHIKEALVVARADAQGNNYLVAYLIMETPGNFNEMEIQNYLQDELPDYMMPAYFIQLEEIPLTPNGKIDRSALPEPGDRDRLSITYISEEMLNKIANNDLKPHGLSAHALQETLDDPVVLLENERSALAGYSKQKNKILYPLSHAQKMIYYTEKTYPRTSCQNHAYIIHYPEELDEKRIEEAINLACFKNETLRTCLVEVEHGDFMGPAQYVVPHKKLRLDTITFPGKKGKESMEKWIEEHINKPFELIDNNLFYFAKLEPEGHKSVYYIKFHHIISDGGSFALLLDDIDKIYQELQAGKTVSNQLNPSHIQFVSDELEYLSSPRTKIDREFWLNYLLPLPEEAAIWSAKEDSSNLKTNACILVFNDDLRSKMHENCRIWKTSLYKIILSALSIYVSRVTGLKEFIITIINHGRYKESHRTMMGMFVNYIPLKIKIDQDMEYQDFIEKIGKEINYIVKNHSKYPGNFISNDLRVINGKDTRYFWNITLVGHPDKETGNFRMEHISSNEEVPPLNIHINCSNRDIEGILELEWVYHLEKFSAADIIKIHQSLMNILTDALENPGKKIREIEFLTGKEKNQIGSIHQQVLIKETRGNRIDAEKIENSLKGYKDIKEVIVVKKYKNSNECLYAYLVSDKILKETPLRQYMNLTIPHLNQAKVPIEYIQLEKMPLTKNIKVNRTLLTRIDPAVDFNTNDNTNYQAPQDDVEKKLVEIWKKVLGRERFGTNENFFSLGGHSLKATTLIYRISKIFNVEFPLSKIFSEPTIKAIAQYIKGAARRNSDEIKAVEKREYYPQSSAQKRLFYVDQLETTGLSYNLSSAFRIKGKMDRETYEKTFKSLLHRHESLRTSFKLINGEPVQMVHDDVDFKVKEIEVGDREIKEMVNDFIRPFDLAKAPLLRIGYLLLASEEFLLLFDMPHIINDGTSMGILKDEFIKLYAGEELLPMKIQYKDFTLWQNNRIQAGKMKKQEEYWVDQYSGDIPRLNLSTDYARPPHFGFEGDNYQFKPDSHYSSLFKNLCTQNKVTLYMGLLSLFYVLMHKYTGQEIIIMGTVVEGRRHADLKNIVGMFVNTLTLINRPMGEKTYQEFLYEVKKNTIQAFENQDMQFEELVEKSNFKRDPSRHPLFDVGFSLNRMEPPSTNIRGVTFSPYESEDKITKNDLTLIAGEVSDDIYFNLQYSTGLFKKSTIEKMGQRYIEILKQVVENNLIKLKDIKISYDFVEVKSNVLKHDQADFGF